MEDQQEEEAPHPKVLCPCGRHLDVDSEAYGTSAPRIRPCGLIGANLAGVTCPAWLGSRIVVGHQAAREDPCVLRAHQGHIFL